MCCSIKHECLVLIGTVFPNSDLSAPCVSSAVQSCHRPLAGSTPPHEITFWEHAAPSARSSRSSPSSRDTDLLDDIALHFTTVVVFARIPKLDLFLVCAISKPVASHLSNTRVTGTPFLCWRNPWVPEHPSSNPTSPKPFSISSRVAT